MRRRALLFVAIALGAGAAPAAPDDRRQALEELKRAGESGGPRVRAALVAQTDRALEDRRRPRPGATRCGLTDEEEQARAIADVAAARPDSQAFSRRWYAAMALRSQWMLCLADVRSWTQAGLKRHPRDPVLLLAAGMAEETEAAFGRRMNVAQLNEMRSAAVQSNRIDRDLGEARRFFAEALAADAAQHEARLRLGRTLVAQKKAEAGRAELERVAREAGDTPLVYLAHLFLARLHQDGGRAAEAERAYRAALAADPSGQAAAFGLAQLLDRADGESGRAVLLAALGHAPRRDARDPYMAYRLGITNRADRLFADLREESRAEGTR